MTVKNGLEWLVCYSATRILQRDGGVEKLCRNQAFGPRPKILNLNLRNSMQNMESAVTDQLVA